MQSPGPPYQGPSVDHGFHERSYDGHLNPINSYHSQHHHQVNSAQQTYNSNSYTNGSYRRNLPPPYGPEQQQHSAYAVASRPNNHSQYGGYESAYGQQQPPQLHSYQGLSRPVPTGGKPSYWTDDRAMQSTPEPSYLETPGATQSQRHMMAPPMRSPNNGALNNTPQVPPGANVGYTTNLTSGLQSSPQWTPSPSSGTPSPLPVSHSTSNSRSPSHHSISPYACPSPSHVSPHHVQTSSSNKIVTTVTSQEQVAQNNNPLQSLQQMVMPVAQDSSSKSPSSTQKYDVSSAMSPTSQSQKSSPYSRDQTSSVSDMDSPYPTYYNMDQNRLCSPPNSAFHSNAQYNSNNGSESKQQAPAGFAGRLGPDLKTNMTESPGAYPQGSAEALTVRPVSTLQLPPPLKSKPIASSNGTTGDESSNCSINLKCDETMNMKLSSNSEDSVHEHYYSANSHDSDSRSPQKLQGALHWSNGQEGRWGDVIGGRGTPQGNSWQGPPLDGPARNYQQLQYPAPTNGSGYSSNGGSGNPQQHFMPPPNLAAAHDYSSSHPPGTPPLSQNSGHQWSTSTPGSSIDGEATPAKKKRGRPFGSKNKPKDPSIGSGDSISPTATTEAKPSPKKVKKEKAVVTEVAVNTSLSMDVHRDTITISEAVAAMPPSIPHFSSTTAPIYQHSSSSKSNRKVTGPYIKVGLSKQKQPVYNVVNVKTADDEKGSKKGKAFPNEVKSLHRRPSLIGASKKKILNNTADVDSATRDASWICIFCKQGSHHRGLGDLFGPYFVKPERNGLDQNDDEMTPTTSDSPVKSRARTPQKRKNSTESPSEKGKAHSDELEVWFHEDCISWSSGVYLVGSLVKNMEEIVKDSRETVCTKCRLTGANLGCLQKGCSTRFHYLCAKDKGCELEEENFSIYCPKHKRKSLPDAVL